MAQQNELRHLLIASKRFLRSVLSVKEGTDVEATIEGIKRDIGFRGVTAWILIFSIFIASIGLNVNSTAVIIGAMLISPLMGPILGIGLSIGTNDFDTLIRSLKNLGIAVSIALLTSTFYFLVTPLDIERSELLARTQPTILDVLIALFGGFAGILAGSRREKTNVIPGVAIATALMPPLCTAGYGLATLKMHFFFGAFYLFFINSVFISLSTFIFVRYLKFPLVTYVNPVRERRYRLLLWVFLVVTVIPSTVIFYHVIQETRFSVAAETFITENADFEGSQLINKKITFADTLSTIELFYIGERITEDKKMLLANMLANYGLRGKKIFPMTKNTVVKIHQDRGDSGDFEQKLSEMNNDLRLKILEDIYTKNEELVKNKDQKIAFLEKELLRISAQDTIPLGQINKEINFHFTDVKEFGFANLKKMKTVKDSVILDTIPTFLVNYKVALRKSTADKENKKMEEWLQLRFNNPKIKVVSY